MDLAITTSCVLNPEREYEIVAGQPEEKEMGGLRHGGVGARLIGMGVNLSPSVFYNW